VTSSVCWGDTQSHSPETATLPFGSGAPRTNSVPYIKNLILKAFCARAPMDSYLSPPPWFLAGWRRPCVALVPFLL